MRVKALNHFTQKLPLVNIPDPKNIEGNNTTNSIIGGIQYGLQGEIENIISHYRKKSNNLFIILTGGDKNYFEILLKNHKFVAAEITLIGLHTILKHNT
jgi:type III pantothenate kinase